MEGEHDVNVDTPNDTGDNDLDTTVDDSLDAEAKVAALEDQNKKLFARAKKAEGFVQDEAGNWVKKPKPQPKQESTLSTQPDTGSIYEQVALLKDIERDEMDSLEDDAKDLGVPVIKYLKSTAGKTRLDAIRKEKKSKDASPEIGASSPVFKKHTQADLAKMSVAELENILPHAE